MKKKEDQQKKPKKGKAHNKWVGLASAGFQMAITIIGCAFLGDKLDAHLENDTPWFTLSFVLFGIFASLYLIIKQINKFST